MVDTTEYTEGKYLNVAYIKSSPSKTGVVITEATSVKGEFGTKLECMVQIDTKMKTLRLNKKSIENLQRIGKDSKDWIGKAITFRIETIQNKEAIVAEPKV